MLRPGGVLVGVVISRFASLHDGLRQGWAADQPGMVESGLHTGIAPQPRGAARAASPPRTSPGRRSWPPRSTAAGFELTALLAVEGPGSWLADADDWLDDPRRREWLLRTIRRVEAEPSLLGASSHVLAVAHRPAER